MIRVKSATHANWIIQGEHAKFSFETIYCIQYIVLYSMQCIVCSAQYVVYSNRPPPLDKKYPLIRNPPLGGTNIVTIDLGGGTITPLIRTPPSEANIVTINLDGVTINLDGGGVSYQGGGRLYLTQYILFSMQYEVYVMLCYVKLYYNTVQYDVVWFGGTQTGPYQTGSYQKGRFIPPKSKLSYLLLFDTTPFICL